MINFEQVNEVLKKLDIEGLLELGAPSDEYEDEAKEIADLVSNLGAQVDELTLLEEIKELWNESFGPFDNEDMQKRIPEIKMLVKEVLSILQES